MKKKINYFREVGSARVEGKYNGSVIAGPKDTFLPHGVGLCKYKDGQIYKGKWKKGKREGTGKLTWTNGDIYIGQWKKDKPNGKGKFYFKQGFQDKNKSDTYVGQVKDWLRHGRGTYTWVSQKMRYQGNWKNNNRHGYGEYKEGNSIYTGNWKDDKRWGKGKITIKKQHSISGTFRHTDLKGKVTMDFWKPFHITYSTKARKYIGNIHNETFQPHGKGYFILKGKKVAVGIWKDGVLTKGKTFMRKLFKINGIIVGRKRVTYWKNNFPVKTKFFK